ncbi:hypothetical protein [Ferrimonas marina]|uniref:Uncharacterized protein n=1 Tax=Ferrimonas marina TaxID=299255 RepID=A0A1M5TMY3_9GAMM|nr:hypothetical protein [Ferrimonas marina]SHH52064.1 hypothetical protein SAMN02745129_2209 [Ferrimonas marina]
MASTQIVELYWPSQATSILLRVSYNPINNAVPVNSRFECFNTDGSPVELEDNTNAIDVDWGKSLVLSGMSGIRNLGGLTADGSNNNYFMGVIHTYLPGILRACAASGWDKTNVVQCDLNSMRIKLLPILHSYVTLKYAGKKGQGDKAQSVLYEIPCRVYYSLSSSDTVQIQDFSFVRPNKHSNRYKIRPQEMSYLNMGFKRALEQGVDLEHFEYLVDQNEIQSGLVKTGIVERQSRTDLESVARNLPSIVKAQMFSTFPSESLDTNELMKVRLPSFFMVSKKTPKKYLDARSCTRLSGNLNITIYMSKVEIPMRGPDRKELLDEEGNKKMRTIHDGYPGTTEMRVFDALLYIAARRGRRMSVENEHVKLLFTIGEIEDYLKMRGITYDPSTIRDALQVLYRSPVTVEDTTGKHAAYDGTFIMSFRRAEGEDDQSAWAYEAMLHKYFSWGILDLQYRPVTLLDGAMPKSIFVDQTYRWLWINFNNATVGQLLTIDVNAEFDKLHINADIRSKRKQAKELADRLKTSDCAKDNQVQIHELKEGRAINIFLEWQASASFVANLKAIQQQSREAIESRV